MRLYNIWTSPQTGVDITVVLLEKRAVLTRKIVLTEVDDEWWQAYLEVKIVLHALFTTVLRDGTKVLTWVV